MKKRILKVLVVTVFAICSFSLVACNSENDKSGGLKKTTAVAPIVYDVSEKESAVENAATVDLSALSEDVTEVTSSTDSEFPVDNESSEEAAEVNAEINAVNETVSDEE